MIEELVSRLFGFVMIGIVVLLCVACCYPAKKKTPSFKEGRGLEHVF